MGLFIRTRLETRRPPPPPSSSLLPPNRPEICSRVVERSVCLWWRWGQVVRERWRGGLLHLPGRAGGSCSWNSWLGSRLYASGFSFFFSSLFPFHHLFAQPVPAAPVTLILPALPQPTQLRAAWGRLDPRGQFIGAGSRRKAPLLRETEFLARAGSGIPGED